MAHLIKILAALLLMGLTSCHESRQEWILPNPPEKYTDLESLNQYLKKQRHDDSLRQKGVIVSVSDLGPISGPLK